jgi:hypothetical protein
VCAQACPKLVVRAEPAEQAEATPVATPEDTLVEVRTTVSAKRTRCVCVVHNSLALDVLSKSLEIMCAQPTPHHLHGFSLCACCAFCTFCAFCAHRIIHFENNGVKLY